MAIDKRTGGDTPNDKSTVVDGADTRRLVKRMGVAGAMVLLLLGGLAVFDQYAGNDSADVAPPPQFTEPVPVPKKPAAQPLQGSTGPVKSEDKGDKVSPVAEPEATAPPHDKQSLLPPPQPEVLAAPAISNGPAANVHSGVTKAAAGRDGVSGKTSSSPERSALVTSPTSAQAEERPEATAAAEPSPHPSAPSPAVSPQSLAPSRLLTGYALQAGVFADPQRAQDLRDRIAQAGIPVTIESRVEVGPFKNRAEAVAARAKLKALGVEAVMLPKKGAPRRP